MMILMNLYNWPNNYAILLSLKFLESSLKKKIILEDEDLENYYDLNKASFTSPEKAKITYTILDSEDIKQDIFIIR